MLHDLASCTSDALKTRSRDKTVFCWMRKRSSTPSHELWACFYLLLSWIIHFLAPELQL